MTTSSRLERVGFTTKSEGFTMIDKIKARDVSLRHLGHTVSLTQAGVIGVPRRFLLAQVTLGYDDKPRGGTVILLKGGDKVVYRAREWDDVAVEDMPEDVP